MTQAAIASSSAFCPADGEPAPKRALKINPAIATNTPFIAKIISFVFSTLIPDNFAASILPPIA
nr:hypothetical protein BV190_00325 [Haemophilus influenzae]